LKLVSYGIGQEQFAKDKRWGFFPSATAAMLISKEKVS